MTPKTLLRVENLRIAFGPLEVVRGVDYQVGVGETLGFVGESGSGKSVTAMALTQVGMRLEGARVTGNQVYDLGLDPNHPSALGPQNLTTLEEKKHRTLRGTHIAYLSQNPTLALNPHYRIGDQMLRSCRQHQVSASLKDLVTALKEVGLEDPIRTLNQRPRHLSGGENQRVLLAQLILLKPSLLIADEPTSAVDAANVAIILKLLTDLKARHRMSMLIITHDFSVAGALCDSISVFYGGLIVESGPRLGVLDQPMHPYTRGLLACARLDVLGGLPGTPISPSDYSDACPFLPRCQRVGPRCHGAMPPLTDTGQGHWIRCYYPGEVADDR